MNKEIKYLLMLFTGLIITLISCNLNQNNLTSEQIVNGFYDGLNTGDFNKISIYVSDSIMTTEQEYILTRNRKELYQQFQWDSVFSPKYELTQFKMDSNSVVLTVNKICKRIEFLQDSAIIYKVRIELKDNQISKIQTTEYDFLDFEKWQTRRDTLVSWIDKNHSEISGFVNDLTISGALNYLKAIELYKKEN